MVPHILYKEHGLPDCDTLQAITKYLYANNINMRPELIVERSFPANITQLPAIEIDNKLILGLDNIIQHYESLLGITSILDKAREFQKQYPNYRIQDKTTHKVLRAE